MKTLPFIKILKGLAATAGVILLLWLTYQMPMFYSLRLKLTGKKTIAERLAEYEPRVTANLQPLFTEQNVLYPPKTAILLFIKSKKTLSLFAPDVNNKMKLLKVYSVLAVSDKSGPKLSDGDNQVPEGIYSIDNINPNSAFHLSLHINYPNEEDKKRANEEGRTNLGSDIMIQGSKYSVGCIALNDSDIEELFVLAAKSNYKNWQVILSPADFRVGETPKPPRKPVKWLPELYKTIAASMRWQT